MKLHRTVVVALGLALVGIVAFAALRAPRTPVLLQGGAVARGRGSLMRGARGGAAVLSDDAAQLERAVKAIEEEFDRLADHVLVAGGPAAATKKRAHHHAAAYTQRTKGTIFVGLASYQDPVCRDSVDSLFRHAANPHAVHVAVVEQHTPDVPGCYPAHLDECQLHDLCLSDNLRIRRVPTKDARGHAFGRYAAMLMYHGEEFVLVARSNQLYVPRWDASLLAMHAQLKASVAAPVLTQIPVRATLADAPGLANRSEHSAVPVACHPEFEADDGVPRITAKDISPLLKAPLNIPWASTELLFANASLLRDVPSDPHLAYVRAGDDALFAARLWTHGWDLYAPSENLLFHFYIRSDAPRVWAIPGNKWWEHQQVSNARVQLFLGVTEANSTEPIVTPEKIDRKQPPMSEDDKRRLFAETDKYGLGTERTLEQYYKFAEVDPVHRQGGKGYCDKARHLGRT